MEKEGYFDEFISFLKDKPNMIELYNIFYIIIKCEAYLHIDFFKENNELITAYSNNPDYTNFASIRGFSLNYDTTNKILQRIKFFIKRRNRNDARIIF